MLNVVRNVLGKLSAQKLTDGCRPFLSKACMSSAAGTGLLRPLICSEPLRGHTTDSAVRNFTSLQRPVVNPGCAHVLTPPLGQIFSNLIANHIQTPLLRQPQNLPHVNLGGVRTVVTYSMQSGRRKTVHAVLNRFYRLNWGIWIRPKAGRNTRVWRKNEAMRKRARQHVFCNAVQSQMLDKMVSKFWHKKTYYVDDPYESYQKRDNYPSTRRL